MAEKTHLELAVKSEPKAALHRLACTYFRSNSIRLKLLKGDGSDRKIYYISDQSGQNQPIVGVFHTNLKENRDYVLITEKKSNVTAIKFQRVNLLKKEGNYLWVDGIEDNSDLLINPKQTINALNKIDHIALKESFLAGLR